MKFVIFVLGLCCFHQASGATHTLQYFYTASSGISDFPEFVDVGVVDGVPITRYDSKTQRKVPLQKWIADNFDQQYWDSRSEMLKGLEENMKVNIQTLKRRFNHTGGIHTFQLMYGCYLEGDGTTRGYFQYAYDGDDFLSLDKSTRTWTPAVSQAVITKRKWEADGVVGNYWKGYLETTCIEWLNEYIEYGKETLDRTVLPQVSLVQKESSLVACHATGFYPEGVMITWKRNGEELQDDVDVGETLPNEDGTFQKKAVLKVSPEERAKGKYTCEVAHKSGEPITKSLDEITPRNPDSEGSFPIGPIIGVIVGLLVVVIAIVGIIKWRRKEKPQRDGFTPANIDDGSSNNSSNQA